jgi:DsbC/DsbD-like thiol-disulfide interchange protein
MNVKKLLLLFFVLMAAASRAQMHEGKELVNASVVCGTRSFAKTFVIGVKLRVANGWHTYWENPGDSGLPFEAEIADSSGYTIKEIQFPTPKRFVGDGSVSYGYDDSVVFLLRIKSPENAAGAMPKFSMKTSWLVCKNICLPGSATLTFDATALTQTDQQEGKKLIDRWTARLPQPGAGFNLENTNAVATPTKNGFEVKVDFVGVAPGTVTEFYPRDLPGFVLDLSGLKVTEAGFILSMQRSEKDAAFTAISGIAKIDTQGYTVTIPVKH